MFNTSKNRNRFAVTITFIKHHINLQRKADAYQNQQAYTKTHKLYRK